MKHVRYTEIGQHIICKVAVFMITPAQCRGARAMLNWSRTDLANAASVAERTIIDFERGARKPYERTLRDIQLALESGGIAFSGDGLRVGLIGN